MLRNISLANKCLLLFGAAVVLIIVAALAVTWVRMNGVVDDGEVQISRQIVSTWEATARRPAPSPMPPANPDAPGVAAPAASVPGSWLRSGQRLDLDDGQLVVVSAADADSIAQRFPWAATAWERFGQLRPGSAPDAEYTSAVWDFTMRAYRYARAVRGDGGTLEGMIILERTSTAAAQAMIVNTVYLLSAGLLALGLAVLTFYLITNYIILSPVRSLRATAEEVRTGNLDTRSEIQTGDEFEELAEAFNAMLGEIQAGQNQLRAINASLDDKLSEVAERNVALYEAAKLKGEFLANVTHELRTPLNSIIGFAELLDEIATKDGEKPEQAGDPAAVNKRKRYVENIVQSGRALLDLINGLLEMAKVEAGKLELNVQPLHLKEACESLVALMKPAADKRAVELRLEVVGDPPVIQTDARKFQQVIFNLLSNAVKFTGDAAEAHAARMLDGQTEFAPRPALVTVRVETLSGRGPVGQDLARVSVVDTGPGIRPEDRDKIFEKFVQLDTGYARRHAGTGLGLAICKELTALLQGEILVDSEPGRGSMFSVILPMRLDPSATAQNKLELNFRSSLAQQRS